MNIIVLLKQVPDLVEELEVDESGTALDRSWLRFILNEFDDHALEQALLLKEQHGGQVKVLALDRGDVDDTLFTALAKGADWAAKITGDFDQGVDSHTAARIFQTIIADMPHDLILTGVQAIDDLDGQTGAILATYLGLPYVGVVSGIRLDDSERVATVTKEYPGGVLAEFSVKLPAVLGIQAAAQPPRYVPVARIRQAMKTAQIEEIAAPDVLAMNWMPQGLSAQPDVGVTLQDGGLPVEGRGLPVRRMFKPEVAGHAEIISGSLEEAVSRIIDILSEKGLVR
ncbi:MAG: electron transfer flavoprotein subunit beta/FixA family protein [Acidobacteria bacterium]|nr:electron transfer flavoprotein subunit beta/FixA family protein [Acidobacteriota bacterium]